MNAGSPSIGFPKKEADNTTVGAIIGVLIGSAAGPGGAVLGGLIGAALGEASKRKQRRY